jgi:hypothetical protein
VVNEERRREKAEVEEFERANSVLRNAEEQRTEIGGEEKNNK